jgi:hypothetical protein
MSNVRLATNHAPGAIYIPGKSHIRGSQATIGSVLSINCPPQFKRLSDIIFSRAKARVNKCGEGILIDHATPQARTTDGVVLAGHRAADEETAFSGSARGRSGSNAGVRVLDGQFVLNAGAVLTGGHGTCANVYLSQVKIDWAGDPALPPDPGLCGTSNLPATKERRGSQVRKPIGIVVWKLSRTEKQTGDASGGEKCRATSRSLGCIR